MRDGDHQPHGRHGHGPGHGHGHKHHGPATFRRGRALEFLHRLDVKRATLAQQLSQPEFQGIQQVISGELKAIEMVRNEFVELFDLHEGKEGEDDSEGTGNSEGEDETRDEG